MNLAMVLKLRWLKHHDKINKILHDAMNYCRRVILLFNNEAIEEEPLEDWWSPVNAHSFHV